MGLARCIAARLGRFHNWNCPLPLETDCTQWVGAYGELAAESWLKAQGWHILRRRWRTGSNGEIDLVCRHQDTLVFVEVKTRRAGGAVFPASAVNQDKRRLMRIGAARWRAMLEEEVPYRYDVVEILLERGSPPHLNLISHAFGEKG